MNIKKLALLSMFALSVGTTYTETIIKDYQLFVEQDCPQSLETAQAATVREDAPVIVKQLWNPSPFSGRSWADKYVQYLYTTIIPGVSVGYITGAGIGFMSGRLFDALVSPLGGQKAPITALARLAAQVGSKWYWEKPLRNKLLNWIQGNIKSMYSYTWHANSDYHLTEVMDESLCNEECGKTFARLFAWIGLVNQVKTV